MRPCIAVTTIYKEKYVYGKESYFNAVFEAGGMPVYLAYTEDEDRLEQYASQFDGFLFSGGVDVDPCHYGEKVTSEKVSISAPRDAFELGLFRHALRTGKPILGICRGVQLINVAMGGSLHQHIEGHSQEQGGAVREQAVTIVGGTPLADMAGAERILVNSFHHQAVKEVAEGLLPMAWADDGICEGVYCPRHRFLLGVQWHPELFAHLDGVAEALFKRFVEACDK